VKIVGRTIISSSRCFASSSALPASSPTLHVTLAGDAAYALATLVPLLGCGEEAAALAFDALALTATDDVEHYALQAIAAEERTHDALLTQLARALPTVDAAAIRRRARRFHIELGQGNRTRHLARIAAVDTAVCTILSRLLRTGTPVSADPVVAALLSRIHRDESRHVAISRRLAVAADKTLRDTGAAARSALADVLALGGDAFECLDVDPTRLFADVRRLPDGLFPA
jgi:hypothetical protein